MSDKEDENEYLFTVTSIPPGHIIVGHVSHFKVLDENGELYFAQRSGGVNDMEQYGLAVSMADSMAKDLLENQRHVE